MPPGRSAARARAAPPAAMVDHLEDLTQVGAERSAIDDTVDHAVREEEFGAVRAGRERPAEDLFGDARTGEADQRLGFGDDGVAETGEGGEHAAGGRVGEDRQERDPLAAQPLDGGRGLRHLQQGEHALLHAGAAAGDDRDQRPPLGDGELGGADKFFPDHDAHAAAEESEIEDGDDDLVAVEAGPTGDDGVGLSGRCLDVAQALAIGLIVFEPERIGGGKVGRGLDKRPAVDKTLDALPGGERKMGAAFVADPIPRVAGPARQRGAAERAHRRRDLLQIGSDHGEAVLGVRPAQQFHRRFDLAVHHRSLRPGRP